MQSHAQTVIIGAGIAGCAAAYHLAKLGRRDIVVVDAGPLFRTGGSTSHAPGGLTQIARSPMLSAFGIYTIDLYASLATADGPAAKRVGALETAETPERWEELKRRAGWAKSWGGEAHLLTPAECGERHPLLDPNPLYGGLFTPGNGVGWPVRAAEAMAAGAGDAAAFHGETVVTDIVVEKGRVAAVATEQGQIDTEEVLICAGIWGPLIGRMAGVTIPLQPMQHQYIRFDPLPELAGRSEEVSLPVLRAHDHDVYCRTHFDALGIGNYQHPPRPVDPEALTQWTETEPDPSKRPFIEEDFAAARVGFAKQVPSLAECAIAEAFNGMFSFTPDGMPLLGEAAGVKGLWVAEAIWITHAAGAGKAIAEWMVDGSPTQDLADADVNRFPGFARTPSFVRLRGAESYRNVHAIIHPAEPSQQPRDLRRTPFHDAYAAQGAAFFDSLGWERARWCEANADLALPEPMPERSGWEAMHWSPVQAAEHLWTRRAASLYDLTPLAKFEARGGGVAAYLNRLCVNQMDVPTGRIVHAVFADDRGGIVADAAVTRLDWDHYWITADAGAAPLLGHWLVGHIEDGERVNVADVTGQWSGLGLWGPNAEAILSAVAEEDVAFDGITPLSYRPVTVGPVPARLLRLSRPGEAGCELFAWTDLGKTLWETLWQAGRDHGLIAAGTGALDSLRLEKARPRWGAELTRDHSVIEAGFIDAVDFKKSLFIGRDALRQERDRPAQSRLALLALDDAAAVALGGEPVIADDRTVGHVTSGNTGYSLGRSLAFSYLDREAAESGQAVEVEVFGHRIPARVMLLPKAGTPCTPAKAAAD